MHDINDQHCNSEAEEIGSREGNMQPFRLDSDDRVESSREYQKRASNSQGWCDLRMYRQSFDVWNCGQATAIC